MPPIITLVNSSTTTDAASFATASFARVLGRRYYAIVSSAKAAGGQTNPTSLTQTGITWTSVVADTRGSIAVSIWEGIPTDSGSSALTFDYAATQESALWQVAEAPTVTGVVQSNKNQATSTSVTTTLSAFQTGGILLSAGCVARTSGSITAKPTGSVEIGQTTQANANQRLSSDYRNGALTSVTYSVSSSDHLIVLAAELSVRKFSVRPLGRFVGRR